MTNREREIRNDGDRNENRKQPENANMQVLGKSDSILNTNKASFFLERENSTNTRNKLRNITKE